MIKNVNYDEFNSILNGGKTAVVDCYADWCGYCKMLEPVLEDLSNEYEIEFLSINTDDNPEFTREYQIISLPTLLFIKKGEVVHRTTGFLQKEQIINLLKDKIL